MAITEFPLTVGSQIVFDSTAFTTASISPTANRLVMMDIFIVFVTHDQAVVPQTVTGGGITWSLAAQNLDPATGTSLTTWYGTSATPGSGVVNVDAFFNCHTLQWSIREFAGLDVGGTNGSNAIVQTGTALDHTNTTGTAPVTLAAFGSVNNGATASTGYFLNVSTAPTCTPRSGWTKIHEQDDIYPVFTGSACLETQWRATPDTTASGTWSLNGVIMTNAVELKSSASATPDPLWSASVM